MRRPQIVRLQLVLLVLVVALLVGRRTWGPDRPEGLVVLSDLEPHRLLQDAFVLEQPAALVVSATGSFERDPSGEAPAGPLAAYGWILRREDRQVVWQMTPQNVQPVQGTLVQVKDTFPLAPGTYDVYFTTYGNRIELADRRSLLHRITDARQHWMNDADEWVLALQAAGDAPIRLRHVSHGEQDQTLSTPDVFWTSGPVRNGHQEEYLFEVQRSTALPVYAVGQIAESGEDYARIEHAVTREIIWQMTKENTMPAGGAPENRFFRGTVELQPGLYRAVYQTDGQHAYKAWEANPPLDPAGWGITLLRSDPASPGVQPFDPWANRNAFAAITRVQDDRQEIIQFRVNQTLPVYAYALGEMVDDRAFDWAWLQEDATGRRVWEMEGEHTQHAGGASKNRLETAFLNLEPGTYTLHYETDDSHAYDDWNDDPPQHPDRWGVTLFPLSAALQPGTVEILARREVTKEKEWGHEEEGHEHAEIPEPPIPPTIVVPSGGFSLNWTALPNETERETIIHLPEKTTFHIRALGEITARGQMDYGWIDDAETGERVWEMKWDNTRPAGGDDRNRLFDGTITLTPGRYQVHFETDMSHAVGDFREYAPHNPEAWGIAINSVK